MGKILKRAVPPKKSYSRYRVLIITGIMLYSLFFASCGIESFPYLAPVKNEDITQPGPGEKRFIFINNIDNNPVYLQGYEIYYKFYSTDPLEPVSTLDYDAHTGLINNQIETNGVTADQLQTTYGYYRLFANDPDLPIPLLSLAEAQKDDRITFVLDFSIIAETIFPQAEYQTTEGLTIGSVELARYVEKEDQITAGPTLYNFTPEDLTSEYTDFSKDLEPDYTNEVFISLYVATYGKSSPFEEFYSYVQHLGAVRLQTTTVPGD